MKKITVIFLAFLLSLSSVISVNAKEDKDIKLFSVETVNKYCELINGCSYAALRRYDDNEPIDAVVYSGLDITDPKILFNAGVFYVSNGVDFSKLTSDSAYSTNLAKKFDKQLKEKGILNTKAQKFYKCYSDSFKESVKLKFDTLGAYTFKAKKQDIEKMLADENTDFVIAGSEFMLKKGDLNSDGNLDKKDVRILNNVISKKYSYLNSLEEKFIEYSSDYNEDEYSDVNDVTALQISIKR